MGKKKHNLTQIQINGIIWITVVLITILAIKLFSSEKEDTPSANDTIQHKEQTILEKKEDSVYQSRRTYKQDQYHHTRTADETSFTPDNFYTHEPPAPTRQPLMVELNSADTLTLTLLNGIGPAYARRIVKYRERLGGFTDQQQLLEVYGFTPELLNHIAPHLRLDTTLLHRIPVNSATLKSLIKHPYMEYYFARNIIELRMHGIVFHSLDDLRTVPGNSDTLLHKLAPYLDFSVPEQ